MGFATVPQIDAAAALRQACKIVLQGRLLDSQCQDLRAAGKTVLEDDKSDCRCNARQDDACPERPQHRGTTRATNRSDGLVAVLAQSAELRDDRSPHGVANDIVETRRVALQTSQACFCQFLLTL